MKPSNVQPPAIAVWLIDLFIPERQNESVKGDLLEEFSSLATKFNGPTARNWYWRHSTKTVAHLIFRTPWIIATALLSGYFVLMNATNVFMERTILPGVSSADIYWGTITATSFASLTASWVLAMIAKGRELVATILLAWLFVVSTVASELIASNFLPPLQIPLLHPILLTVQASLVIALGLTVRQVRLMRSRRRTGG